MKRVLVVEDEASIRELVALNLKMTGWEVLEAPSAERALELIQKNPPCDVALLDIMLPGMDGFSLCETIRHGDPYIGIIMASAKGQESDKIRGLSIGADDYITKPFSIELLLARIDNLLTQRRKLFEKFSSQSARNKVVELAVEDVVVTDRDEEFMKNVMAWLGENVENSELTIDQLASHLGLGRTTMYNKLKSLTGKSPVELIKEYRITKSKLLLRTGQFSVSEVAYKVGFSDPGYFSRCFREQFHMSPAEYLKTHNLKQDQDTKTA